jgi:hypothetical protein
MTMRQMIPFTVRLFEQNPIELGSGHYGCSSPGCQGDRAARRGPEGARHHLIIPLFIQKGRINLFQSAVRAKPLALIIPVFNRRSRLKNQ